MIHKIKKKHFNRTPSHKKALFYNLSRSLIKNELIITTLQKAKELRKYVEPLITLSKEYSLKNKKNILKKIKDKKIVNKLFLVLGKRYNKRNGGYTRILKYKYRKGDGATLAIIELIS